MAVVVISALIVEMKILATDILILEYFSFEFILSEILLWRINAMWDFLITLRQKSTIISFYQQAVLH